MLKFREAKASIFKLSAERMSNFEHLPWTAAGGTSGIRDGVLHLINTILKNGVRTTAENELRQQHFQHLVELIDFYLSGRKTYLESIRDTEKYDTLLRKYESERSDLIFNFGNFVFEYTHNLGKFFYILYLDLCS